MSGNTNQQHIRNFRYETIALAIAESVNARDTDTCFIFANKGTYYYEHGSVAVIDGSDVLSANGGAWRWLRLSWRTPVVDRYTITPLDVINNTINLSNTPAWDKHLLLFYEGQHWDEWEDYTIGTNVITFISTITAGDKIVAKYFI